MESNTGPEKSAEQVQPLQTEEEIRQGLHRTELLADLLEHPAQPPEHREESLRVLLCFLELIQQHSEINSLLEAAVSEVRAYTGCEAVGIRVLDAAGGIPYLAYQGFSRQFYEQESPLSIKTDECMCINVIKGACEPHLPFYTPGGSFYMNGTTRFLATVSEEDKGSTRNVCNREGYESVALIPLRRGDRILGLIHVADRRENMVPLYRVEILEKAAQQLGAAFLKVQTEVALRESEAHYRSLFNNMLNGFAYCRMLFEQGRPVDFIYLDVNDAFSTLTGLTGVKGKRVTEVIPGIKESDPDIFEIYGRVALTGIPERFETYVEALKMWFSVSVYSSHREHFVAVFDVIDERKRMEEALRESERRVKTKLESILSPAGDLGQLELEDIIDAPAIQSLMDDFYQLTQLPMSIIDLRGKVLVGVGWQDICVKFHRVHPETCKHCLESDTQLTQGVFPGTVKQYKCKNGMWDIVTPLMVGGKHVGNLFMGHFLYDDETPDYDFFRSQARRYGFDEETYLAALERLPRLSRETVNTALGFYTKLAYMVSMLSHSNIKLARSMNEQEGLLSSLKESEEKYRLAMQASLDGLWDWDIASGRVYYSPAWATILEEEEVAPAFESWQGRVSPLDLADFQTSLEEHLAGRTSHWRQEHRLRTRSGAWKWVVSRGQVTARDAGGRPLRMAGTMTDISQRKKNEEKIKADEQFLSDIFTCIKDGLVVLDRDLTIIQANPAMEKYSHNSPLLGRKCFEVFHRRSQPCEECPAQYTLATGQAGQLVVEVDDDRGGKILADVYSYPLISTTGQLRGVVEYVRDVTEQKKAEDYLKQMERQLLHAQKMEALGTLAGGIAHDFNNILGIIMGYTEVACIEVGNAGPLYQDFQQVLGAAHRAKELVKQILTFSRSSKEEMQPVQIGLIVQEAMRLIRASLPATLEINSEVASKAMVLADRNQIFQVLMNLCSNAAQAMQRNGATLRVTLTDVCLRPDAVPPYSGLQPGPCVSLVVRDTGSGIAPEIIDRIFDPFFTTKEAGIGTGLGLAIVHGIVKSHGGAILVDSTPGKETTFNILLPVLESLPLTECAMAATLPRGQERILVVDDEPALAEVNQQILESLGYQVECCTSSVAALEAVRRQSPDRPVDLVITDMTMPHLTGAELAQELRLLQPALPIILLTGFSEKISAPVARSLGIREILLKPVSMRDLAELVRKVLDQK